jgi:predicted kinase
MCDQPLFESLEGLRGTGKSTLAPLLAAARNAVLVPTVPAGYQQLRREIDKRDNADARLCFYLSALFAATDEIQRYLSAGTPVVVESYFARCLSSHEALGARVGITLPPGLPQPAAYQLVCEEDERRRRLAARDKPASQWDALGERVIDRLTHAYRRFPARRVDTTGITPREAIGRILALTPQAGC